MTFIFVPFSIRHELLKFEIVSSNEGYLKWELFLHERNYTPHQKKNWRYTHNIIRSAYSTLNRYQDHLFTRYDHPELRIPSTNNSIEGVFTNLKIKVTIHKGLKRNRKIKLINHFWKNSNTKIAGTP